MRTFKNTPLTDNNTDYFALSLIERGIADTRALKIAEGLKANNWGDVATAICYCDCYNFKKLYQIEPRLMFMAIEKDNALVIQERINDIEGVK